MSTNAPTRAMIDNMLLGIRCHVANRLIALVMK
jgi:hypothetical protein